MIFEVIVKVKDYYTPNTPFGLFSTKEAAQEFIGNNFSDIELDEEPWGGWLFDTALIYEKDRPKWTQYSASAQLKNEFFSKGVKIAIIERNLK